MESSPLIKAHDHAKAASVATHTSDTTVAVNEHTRAAGEFANAARNTSSVEALRTLKLLEQHHRRLSELLQIPGKPPTSQASSENDSQASEKDDSVPEMLSSTSPVKHDSSSSNEKNTQPLPTLPKQPRYPARDLGASIASNLASARGIRSKYRSQPLSPSVSNTEAPGNMETASRRSGTRTKMQNMLDNSDRPNSVVSPEKERLTRQSSSGSQDTTLGKDKRTKQADTSDEGFSRFYNAFGNIINRISAPLAFAGLPLVSEEEPEPPAPVPTPIPAPESPIQKRIRVKGSPSVSAEPDLRKIYSKAALRAVSRDGQSANDSFYVVPTSGHTASYASILTFADKEKRRMEANSSIPEDLDEDDFVDAKESQLPRSPAVQRLAGKARADRDKDLTNVVEELYLENKSLKDMLDKLSKRLHAFESMSQNSGMRLAESMRLMRPSSPLASGSTAGGSKTPTPSAGLSDEALAKRNRELEEQLLAVSKQMEETERNYNKARANLVRYREKWEQLKAGAKARRAGGSASGSGSAGLLSGGQGGSLENVDDGRLGSPGLG
ncbi:uncharacterized protein F4822DRAFT_422239 [Hypoxylon trugodes]|uniref:uncharacterized protein n=1 Tax=Hypoxylon trugodes TaxID=326681 RepID=UPI00218CE807|nr:uncharacterized protein F4822DRAFT_422239 [Hypoxylon trugodes]KAI1383128.1 hypothetical protein F4822DRAFT_422239 [Hypoxylon trugodes]